MYGWLCQMRAQVERLLCQMRAQKSSQDRRWGTKVDSIYLSSELPRLQLANESELVAAVADGLLEENHFLDLKREVGAGKAQNKETARDLAQSWRSASGHTVLKAQLSLPWRPSRVVRLPPTSERCRRSTVERTGSQCPHI